MTHPLGHPRAGAELPVLCSSSFPLAICAAHGRVCTSVPLSQFGSPSLSPTVSTSVFSMGRFLKSKFVNNNKKNQVQFLNIYEHPFNTEISWTAFQRVSWVADTILLATVVLPLPLGSQKHFLTSKHLCLLVRWYHDPKMARWKSHLPVQQNHYCAPVKEDFPFEN